MAYLSFPQIKLIRRHSSLGFSAGNNAGIALATADHLLFLNPDTVVHKDVFAKTVRYLEEHPKEARIIVNKVILAATARHAARKARELVQRKTVLTGGG